MKTTYSDKVLVILLLLLASGACLVGLLDNAIYKDGPWVNAQWFGQDMVTLGLAVPMLAIASYRALVLNDQKWLLALTGTVFYFAYVYTFYAIVAEFSALYLLHMPVFGLSLIMLFRLFHRAFNGREGLELRSRKSKFAAMAFLALVALTLTLIWTSDIFAHLTMEQHRSGTPDGKPPLIIYSLDLALIVPLMVSSVIGLYKESKSGMVLAAVMLVMVALMGFALMGMAASMYWHQIDPEVFLIVLWSILGLFGSLIAHGFIKHLVWVDKAHYRL